jgi:hypothetical protein
MRQNSVLNRTAIVVVLLSAAACVPYTWFDKVQYDNMAARLEYQGFSFERPPNRLWYFLQSEQSYTSVTLRRDFWIPSDTHTFYALVAIGGIDRQPESHEDFAELARSEEQKADYPIEKESYEQHLTTRQNQWCIRFDSSYKVTGHPKVPDRELRMILHGYRCLHPAWPERTLDFYYSERGLPSELDPKLSSEGETFLEGVRIDIAPGTPAA